MITPILKIDQVFSWKDKKKLYLTVMYMWDEKAHDVLSAKYDPLKIRGGEAGLLRTKKENNIEDVSMSGLSSCANSKNSHLKVK